MIKSRRVQWIVYAACTGEPRKTDHILVGKPLCNKLLGRITGKRILKLRK
jgi:hypothetical protein